MRKGAIYPQYRKDPYVRFWQLIAPGRGDCWEFFGVRKKKMGYGQFWLNETGIIVAHRAAWILSRGPIPKGMCVLHRCDNPPCVNPDHLFLGTKRDNNLDCFSKGRFSKGSNHPTSKLTEQDVLKIRALHKPRKVGMIQISRKLNLPQSAIRGVISGKSWKHLL